MTPTNLVTAIIDALKGGFGIVKGFVDMIRDTFTGLFVETIVTGEGSSAVTSYQISNFAIVALVMMGIAIVTGLGMLIFKRFFKRT